MDYCFLLHPSSKHLSSVSNTVITVCIDRPRIHAILKNQDIDLFRSISFKSLLNHWHWINETIAKKAKSQPQTVRKYPTRKQSNAAYQLFFDNDGEFGYCRKWNLIVIIQSSRKVTIS